MAISASHGHAEIVLAALLAVVLVPVTRMHAQTPTQVRVTTAESAMHAGPHVDQRSVAVLRQDTVLAAVREPEAPLLASHSAVKRRVVAPAGAPPQSAQSDSRGPHGGVWVLGGVTANPSLAHGVVGVGVALEWRVPGIIGLAMLGRGSEYDSRLIAAGTSLGLAQTRRVALRVMAGYGIYGEKASTGLERDANGPLVGASVAIRLGGAVLRVMVTDLTGRYDEPDVTAPIRFHVLRYSLGLGL